MGWVGYAGPMSTVFNRFGDYLLRLAFASEFKRAGLMASSIPLSFGRVTYLHRKSEAGPISDAVVMLHGAGADKTGWVRFATYVHARFQLVIPDLPGHGDSAADSNLDYGIDAQAERLRELLRALHIERVHLIANSMGGAIALQLAHASPDLVSSLVLIDVAGVDATPSWLRLHVAETGVNPMLEIHTAADYRAMMCIGMESPPYIPGLFLSALARDFSKRSAINQKIAADIEKDLDKTEILQDIATPSLVIWGAADRITHVDDAELLHQRLRDSRKLVLDGVGHVPMVEAPKRIAAACNAFYKEILG